jgi:Ner family transcriptional regulator
MIAEAVGVHPAEICPGRYYDDAGLLLDRKARIRL